MGDADGAGRSLSRRPAHMRSAFPRSATATGWRVRAFSSSMRLIGLEEELATLTTRFCAAFQAGSQSPRYRRHDRPSPPPSGPRPRPWPNPMPGLRWRPFWSASPGPTGFTPPKRSSGSTAFWRFATGLTPSRPQSCGPRPRRWNKRSPGHRALYPRAEGRVALEDRAELSDGALVGRPGRRVCARRMRTGCLRHGCQACWG